MKGKVCCEFPEDGRESAARFPADGLAAMMNYGKSQAHQGGRVAVAKAISYLGAVGEVPTIESLVALLGQPEEGLKKARMNAVPLPSQVADEDVLRLAQSRGRT